MGLFNNKKSTTNTENRSTESTPVSIVGYIPPSSNGTYSNSKALKISTVYRCVNLISDSIASLPLYPYTFINPKTKVADNWKYIDESNSLYNILNVQANAYMSSFMLKKMAVITMLQKGNAYILIDKKNTGENNSLTLLNSDYIKMLVNGTQVGNNVDVATLLAMGIAEISYYNTLTQQVYDKSQIIHLINFPDANGLYGYSTLEYAATVLGIAYHTNEHSFNFFKGGANLGGILRPIAGVTLLKGQAKKAKDDFVNALNPLTGGVSGGVVALDAGLEYQPIAINPKDSQMIENKAFNVLEICRFYGVPPSLAFSEGGKFNTAEQQSLDFLNNGLLPIIEKIENEFFRKLYLQSEWFNNELRFDVDNLVRLDATTKIDVITKQISAGIKTPNEGRAQYNMPFPVTGGNKAFISTNLQTLDMPAVTGSVPGNQDTGNQSTGSGNTQTNNTINNIAK